MWFWLNICKIFATYYDYCYMLYSFSSKNCFFSYMMYYVLGTGCMVKFVMLYIFGNRLWF
jgi:hypothetical protein